MKKKITPKGIWEVIKNTFSGFSDNSVLKLSASLAYYTVFSLGPLLIVILYLCGLFLGREAIEGSIYNQMKGFIGAEGAAQIQEIIKNASISGKGNLAAVIGIITLLFGATTVFAEIQDSINSIWNLKPKPKKSWFILIKARVLSFGIIAALGFLLLVSLGVTALIEALSKSLKEYFPDVTVAVFYILNLVITFSVVTILFAVIFKVLPDATVKWRDIIAGAVVTAILFMIGKFGISYYISKADIGSTFGAAGSLVILLVWIYYSSVILYFGAEFTKAYAVKFGSAIHPNRYAVIETKIPVEEGHTSVQQAEKNKKETERKINRDK